MAMSAGGDPSRPEMNVTPLIDVLLVLIIIFMVIVVEQGNKGLTAQPLPSTDPAHPGVQRTIVAQLVSVPGQDQQPTLKIKQQNVDWNNLEAELQRVFATRAEKVAFVRGDQDVDFEYVAEVIDTARHAGVERVGLMGEDQ